jgi:hypothetical protein
MSRSSLAWRRVTESDVGPILAYHRLNLDGTYDSLCLRCFWTAAVGFSKSEVAEAERSHVCGRVPALIGLRRSPLMLQ